MKRRVQKNPHLRTLEQALAGRFGWQPGSALRETIAQAVALKTVHTGMDEVSYCRMAAASTPELQAFAEEIAPTDSRFFREPEHVEALRERILPELLAARAGSQRLRAWSMACGSGEEAYSVAILLREAIPTIDDWRVDLLATDLRGAAIIAASRARYRASALRVLDPTTRNRNFMGVDEPSPDREFDLIPIVRRMVSFRRGNLCDPALWTTIDRPFDLVLCQNVLLYFHRRAIDAILTRLADAIEPGGYVVVSPTEAELIEHPSFRAAESLPTGFFARIATAK